MSGFIQNLEDIKRALGIHDGGPNSLKAIAFQVIDGPENKLGENTGSLTVLWYATVNNLKVGETLLLFGEHYDSVLGDPEGQKHLNIRAVMKHDPEAYVGSIVTFHGCPVARRV